MSPRALLIFSHELTPEQEQDLQKNWHVTEIINLPDSLKNLWKAVPPHLEEIRPYLQPVIDWMKREGQSGDLALVQGDFGATYIMVNEARNFGLVPVYSTTKREVEETTFPGGIVKQNRVFSHQIFRIYGR